MKISASSSSASVGVTAGAPSVAAPLPGEALTAPATALQSEVLSPATQAMRAMPDFDAARVAELRAALTRGELPFDPARLAGLIQKFHGGR